MAYIVLPLNLFIQKTQIKIMVFISLLLARPLPRGRGRFKYSEDAGYKDFITAEWLDNP